MKKKEGYDGQHIGKTKKKSSGKREREFCHNFLCYMHRAALSNEHMLFTSRTSLGIGHWALHFFTVHFVVINVHFDVHPHMCLLAFGIALTINGTQNV